MSRRRPKVGSESLRTTGFDDLDRFLLTLEHKIARKIVRASMGAMLTVCRKNLRRRITQTSGISPQLKRALRGLVGSRFARTRGRDQASAKFGFAVGMKTKSKRAAGKRSGKSRSGVGVSAANAHWFILGTAHRFTKAGRYSGRLLAVRVVRRAAIASRAEAHAAATAKGAATLSLELGREIRLR